MVKSYQDLKEKTLGMIAFFETSNTYPECYGITSPNWDGAGVSHGVLQYNYKTGSLQTLWNHMNNNYNQLCRDIFGTDYTKWSDTINATFATQQAFGNEIMNQNNNHLCLPPWDGYFMALGTSQPSIDKQIEMSGSWHINALKWFKNLGLYSRRGYALMFDISVQMGRFLPQNVCLHRFRQIDPTGKTKAQIEEEKLNIIVELCSNGNNRCFPTQTLPNLPQIVFDRKNAVVVGSSNQGFSIGQYDLEYEPAFTGAMYLSIPKPSKPQVTLTNLIDAVRLDWTSATGAETYKIYRSNSIDTLGSMLAELSKATLTYADNTVTGGSTYYYTVKAVNFYEGTNSDKLTGLPIEPTPTKPQLELTNLTNAVRLDWQTTENTKVYKIYRSNSIDTLGPMLVEIPVETTTFTDDTVTGGLTYYYTVKAVNINNATNSDKRTGLPFIVQVYENKTVDFEGYTAWQIYDTTAVTNDFGNKDTLVGDDRLKIDTTGRLRFYLPAGQLGTANTGGLIKANIAGKIEYTFEYEIRFDSGFPWSKGGKIPGVSGGKGYTGGEPATAGDGFSVRIMWREGGRLIPYVYHYNQPGQYGDTFGATIGYLTDDKAYKMKYYIKLNTGTNADGILRIYIDNVMKFEKTNIVYRTDESKIDTAHLAIFAGGSTVDWNMTADGYIRLSYVTWQ
jgi:hypothetical protein